MLERERDQLAARQNETTARENMRIARTIVAGCYATYS